MWSRVEAFQTWENTVINLQPPRIMWCYKWRQLQTLFLQQEQNSVSATSNPPLPELFSISHSYQCPGAEPGCLSSCLPVHCCPQQPFLIVTPRFLWMDIVCATANIWHSQTKSSHRTGWPLVGSQIPSYGWQLHQLNSIGEVAWKSVLCVPSIVLWKLFRCLIYLMVKQWLCSLVGTLSSVVVLRPGRVPLLSDSLSCMLNTVNSLHFFFLLRDFLPIFSVLPSGSLL